MKNLVISVLFLLSMNSYAFSLVEIATQEQRGSASCALSIMPNDAKEKLLSATAIHLKEKQSGLELNKAFQNKAVPESLAKCFEIHAVVTMGKRSSERDFFHFYDVSERYMRLLLLIDIAKTSGMESKEIKNLKEAAFKSLEELNLEYY